jgi:tetratricopeptide (TPR) repeat protein
MKPEARATFDKGMIAAGQQEWQTAIRYFLKAQESAPDAPEILFNLGLAESKVQGRELRAVVWFRAFLMKAPSVPNADAVRKEIGALEIRAEATIDKLINQTKQLVAQEDANSRSSHYVALAVAIARAGDISDAKQTALKCAGAFLCTNEALARIAAIEYNAGDTTGAEKTILDIGSGIKYGTNEKEYVAQSRAYGYIASLQAIRGDFSGAEATIGRVRSPREKAFNYLFVALEGTLAGKRDQALSLVAKALDTCDREKDCQNYDLWMLQDVGWKIQSYLGETEVAKKTFALYAAKSKNQYARFNPSLNRKAIEDMATGRDLGLVSFRKGLDFIGDQRLLTVTPHHADSPEKWVVFLKEKLIDELFIDQQSAIKTIAGKARPQDIVAGMLKAIESITDRLSEIRALSK